MSDVSVRELKAQLSRYLERAARGELIRVTERGRPKAILPVLWELYPDHPNLLPAYFGTPGDLLEWVAKPLHGREGSNIRIHTITSTEDDVHDGPYDTDTMVYQEWSPLPSYEGNRAVRLSQYAAPDPMAPRPTT